MQLHVLLYEKKYSRLEASTRVCVDASIMPYVASILRQQPGAYVHMQDNSILHYPQMSAEDPQSAREAKLEEMQIGWLLL